MSACRSKGDDESQRKLKESPTQSSCHVTSSQHHEEREYARLREMLPQLSDTQETVSRRTIVEEAARYISELHDQVRETLSQPADVIRATEFLHDRISQDLQFRGSSLTARTNPVLTSDLRPFANSEVMKYATTSQPEVLVAFSADDSLPTEADADIHVVYPPK